MLGVLALALHKVLGGPASTARDSARLSPAEREAQAELDVLLRRHRDGVEDKKGIRQDLLAFRGRRAGLPQTLQAAVLLHELPSPLDALESAKILPRLRFDEQPPELVAIVPMPAASAVLAPEDFRVLTLSTARPAQVVFVDLLTGRPGRRFERVPAEVVNLSLAPDGKKCLLAGRGKQLAVWDAISGREVRKLEGHAAQVTVTAFSPTGRWRCPAARTRPSASGTWKTARCT